MIAQQYNINTKTAISFEQNSNFYVVDTNPLRWQLGTINAVTKNDLQKGGTNHGRYNPFFVRRL